MKKAKTSKKTKSVKKVRTPKERKARNEKRKLRRLARKEAIQLKGRIEAKNAPVKTTEAPTVFPWKAKVTSDGLPFSQSIDNPDSLLSQLKRAEADKSEKAISEDEKRKNPHYASWSKYGTLELDMN